MENIKSLFVICFLFISACKKEVHYLKVGAEKEGYRKEIITNEKIPLKPLHNVSLPEVINVDLTIIKTLRLKNFNQDAILEPFTPIKLIRKVYIDNKLNYLAVNSNNLRTYIIEEQNISTYTQKLKNTKTNNRFSKMLKKYKTHPIFTIESYPFVQNNKLQFVLTIDMCRSSNDPNLLWEKVDLFDFLVNFAKKENKSIPITLFVTNRWMINNKSKFQQLIKWDREGLLKITWGNHSTNHALNQDETGRLWFLTENKVNFEEEILQVEKTLIGQEIVPSVFFRFPGLVYNKKLLKRLNEFSLMAIDSRAWINKGQPLKNNVIVLIHGNGNEHSGIIKFRSQIEKFKDQGLLTSSSFIDIHDIN